MSPKKGRARRAKAKAQRRWLREQVLLIGRLFDLGRAAPRRAIILESMADALREHERPPERIPRQER